MPRMQEISGLISRRLVGFAVISSPPYRLRMCRRRASAHGWYGNPSVGRVDDAR